MERIGKATTMAFRLAISERETIEALAVEAQCRSSEMLRRLVRQALQVRELQAQGLIDGPALMAGAAGPEAQHA